MGNAEMRLLACGEFGAEVLAHIRLRQSSVGTEVVGYLVTGLAPTRASGGELAADRLAQLEPLGGTSMHLIAAADEPAGGGALTQLLGRHGFDAPVRVWLALPSEGSDQGAQARAYATLLELEALRRSGRGMTIALGEMRGTRQEAAQAFGDALLWNLDRSEMKAGYLGFGFGVVRDPVLALQRRLAMPVLRREVERFLREPDPPHLLAGVRSALHEPVRLLLFPVESCAIFFEGRAMVSGPVGDLSDLFAYYDMGGDWYHQAMTFWSQVRAQAQERLATALGQSWRSGFEAIYAEAQAGLTEAHGSLESAIGETEELVGEYEETINAARLALTAGSVELDQVDRLLAGYMLEGMRLMTLERFALAFDGVVELVMDGLRAKVEGIQHLLQQVEEHRESSSVPRLAHALQLVPSAEQEQEWLSAIAPRRTQACLRENAEPDLSQLKEAARKDVERFVRTQRPPVDLPSGHRIREAWLLNTEPAVSLVKPPGFTYRVDGGLPGSYREELTARVGRRPLTSSGGWIPGEWAVYSETEPFALADLRAIPAWQEAYRKTSARQRTGLHAVPEPTDGWPDLMEPGSGPRPDVAAALQPGFAQELPLARSLVRAAVLGLLSPQPDGFVLQGGRRLVGLVGVLAALREEGEVTRQVAQLWMEFTPAETAASFAVLRWFQTSVLDGDRGVIGQSDLALLHEAVECEREHLQTRLAACGEEWIRAAQQMVEQIGGPADNYTEPNGPWRAVIRRRQG